MDWTDTFNALGLAYTPPPATDTPLDVATSYASGALPASSINGVVTNRLQVGTAANADNSVFIDSSGVYIGNTIPTQAPFYVDMQGNLTALSAIISGLITASTIEGSTLETGTSGQRVVIDAATNTIYFYDSAGVLAGSIFGGLVPGGSGNYDTLIMQSAQSLDSAVKLIYTDGTSNIAQIFLDGFGGTPNINLNAQTSLTSSSAINISDTDISIATGGNIDYLPNGMSSAPTITGSKSGNVALANLLSALDLLGLIIDSTT